MDDLKARFMAALFAQTGGSTDVMVSAAPIGHDLGLDGLQTERLATELRDEGLVYLNLAPVTVTPTELGAAWMRTNAGRQQGD